MSAAGCAADWAVAHLLKAETVLPKPYSIGFQRGLQHAMCPFREVWIELVVHPLPLAAIQQQATSAQLGEVTGNLRLAIAQCADQLAHAQLPLLCNQGRRAGTGFIG